MDSQDFKREIEDFKVELDRNINSFKSDIYSMLNSRLSKNDDVEQLKNPLDAKTKDIIRETAPFVVTKAFENTACATSTNYGIIFSAPSPCVLMAVSIRYNTASTSGTLNVERLQGTEALGAGDTLLDSAISMSATANTTYDGTLKKTDAIFLRDGDALALVVGGTLTSLVGLCVTIKMRWI